MPERTHRITYSRESEVSVLDRILSEFEELTEQPAESLPPLFESVDPEALQRILDHANTDAIQLVFTYCGYTVRLTSDRD